MKTQALDLVNAPASRRRLFLGLAAATTLAALPGVSPGAAVTLNTSDPLGSTSFNIGTRWSDGQAPNAANDYFVPNGVTLRTPSDSTSITFAGNSLTVGDNNAAVGQLLMKNLTNSIITVNNLTLNKGLIANGGNAAAAATNLTLASNLITIAEGGGTFDSGAAGRFITVSGLITGSGPVTVANMGGIGFTAANTYTGTTTVTNGALNATDGVGLPTNSALNLAGGALATSGTFTRNFGTNAGQVVISGTGGFSAVGGDLTVAIGGTAAPTQLVVGQNGFTPTNMPLNYSTATGTIDFRNPVDLAGTTTFGVQTNTTTAALGATISGVISDSVGNGSFTKNNVGLLTLTATNTYGGRTNINGGFLRGTDGVNIPAASNITFGGGVFAPTTNTFTRSVGTGPGQVSWTAASSGGFTALGQDLTVAFGGTASPTPLVWGTTDGFNPNVLILGGRLGTNTVTLANAIDLSTSATNITRTITSHGGVTLLNGIISNTGAAQGTLGIEGDGTVGSGLVIFNGANTYGGNTLIDTGTAGAAAVRATNNLSFGTSLIQFNPPGAASTARLELVNNITLANNVWFSGRNNASAAVQSLSGDNTMAGTFSIRTGGNAYIIQSDSGTLTLSGASGNVAGTAISGSAPTDGNPASGIRNVTLQGAGNGVLSGLVANGTATVGLIKAGSGTWAITSTASTNTGATLVAGGRLDVSALANGGSPSSLGAAPNAAANLVLAGGTLRYVGGATSTDRSFSVGVTGGTIDSSGTGEVVFSNTAANVAVDAPTTATFATASTTVTLPNGTIAGVAVGQTIAATGIPAGATITAVDYSVNTVTISAPTTAAGAAGTPITVGTAPARTLTLAGTNTGNNAIEGAIANAATGGVVNVTKTGAGTWALNGANTYTGTTTVNNGTLRVGPAARGVLLAGTGTTGGTDVRNGAAEFTYADAGSNPVSTIRGLLAAAFTDAVTPGVMDSGTLRSSTSTITRGLGYRDTGSGVIVKAALFGDADLDGGVSINDFNTLAGNFGQSTGKVWVDGDFDYDGGVSINDFNLLAGGFGQSLPPTSEVWAGLLAFAAAHNDLVAFEAVTGVPEPTSLGLIAAGATLGLRRRRKA